MVNYIKRLFQKRFNYSSQGSKHTHTNANTNTNTNININTNTNTNTNTYTYSDSIYYDTRSRTICVAVGVGIVANRWIVLFLRDYVVVPSFFPSFALILLLNLFIISCTFTQRF